MVPRFAFYTHRPLAVRPLKTTIQPSFSTIPCKILYLLANPVLPFPMFSSQSTSPTSRSPLLHPSTSNLCHPERSEGSAFRLSRIRTLTGYTFTPPDFYPFNFKLSTANSPSLSPFPATLTDNSQLTENSTTLSPVPATLTSLVKHKSFICHSYRKHPGWGSVIANFVVAQTSVCALLRQSASEGHVGGRRRRVTLSLSSIYRSTQGVPARRNDPIRRQVPGQG